jgi:GTPase
MFSKIQAQHR